ncbi:MAG TPA: hypothetical protein PLZ21_00990 [Armatimonadota bacterium]|nr:hypothetical protein [Armatimonadota bacterium]HOP79118.1 hypothetical protein [Armatimonadota bacterium]
MSGSTERFVFSLPVEQRSDRRKLVMVVSSDKSYAESLRSHLARDFDVLMAKDGGEAAAKSNAVKVDVVVVDLGSPVLGISALSRIKNVVSSPLICALTKPEIPSAKSQFDFDYVLARPTSGADLPDRVRFILAKAGNETEN